MDEKEPTEGRHEEVSGVQPIGPLQFPTFLAALFDELNVKILRATAVSFLSVKQIAEACDIPMRACYRRVQALLKEGLLCPKPDDPKSRGRPSSRYRSNIGNVYVRLSDGDINVKMVWPKGKLDVDVYP